ncbi:recombinase family protein [Bradyrhizobium vignae]|uniref:Resolvase/invertase-type recombinase catalytic domain-containing protein n=1 Tax=Bradyrhizobium vignae TaxID=1549949 RepID=A0A2U3PUP7_9BRAD|nr:recombinase family protein [Bradyrhizobium vignae]SPP92846.1 protein of unknown function [Bradyrhizobium vignae]
MKAKKFFSYYRTAKDEDPTQFALQAAYCTSLIQSVGGIPVAESSDIGSGLNARLPGYLRLVAAISGGDVDAVVVSTLDRLSRDPIQVDRLLDRCRLCGVEIWVARDGVRLHKGYPVVGGLGKVRSKEEVPLLH